MSDRLTAWVRTVVPTLWAALIAWLISLGVPPAVTDAVGGLAEPLLVPLALAAVYAGLRWLEPRLPAWLAVVLIGSTKTPVYAPFARGGVVGRAELRWLGESEPEGFIVPSGGARVVPPGDLPDTGR